MIDKRAPTTSEEFLALPIVSGLAAALGGVAFFVEDNTVMMCRDADGNYWRLGRLEDGTWVRRAA